MLTLPCNVKFTLRLSIPTGASPEMMIHQYGQSIAKSQLHQLLDKSSWHINNTGELRRLNTFEKIRSKKDVVFLAVILDETSTVSENGRVLNWPFPVLLLEEGLKSNKGNRVGALHKTPDGLVFKKDP